MFLEIHKQLLALKSYQVPGPQNLCEKKIVNANVNGGMSFNVCGHWERYKHLLLNSGIGGYIKQKTVMKEKHFSRYDFNVHFDI